MSLSLSRWQVIAPSRFSWEQEAFDFVRAGLPDHDPYRAWQNFEFIAADGSVNEVDLLVFSPQGLFLVEVKSRPGVITGDAGTWSWRNGDQILTLDNPLPATNAKAKKLKSLLEHQKALQKGNVRLPFVEALVFCSDPGVESKLEGAARTRICFRDPPSSDTPPVRSGILAALQSRSCDGLSPRPLGQHDRTMAKLLAQALDEAGIRPSQGMRRVKDYLLEALLMEGRDFQDWQAVHVSLKETRRRVRLYQVPPGTSTEERRRRERLAQREFNLLESLQHPGILRVFDYTEHDIGPALIFEHDTSAMRLDHYLKQRGPQLAIDERMELLRQIAEAVRFAHEKRIIHRALSPQSVLVFTSGRKKPAVKIFNWQVGFRRSSSTTATQAVRATEHVAEAVEDASAAYMAPEAIRGSAEEGEYLDVFSLGALAYFLFSGVPPAVSAAELHRKLAESRGLKLSAVLNGAAESMQRLVEQSTNPDVLARPDSAGEFLKRLDGIEDELTRPHEEIVDDPAQASQGDRLPDGFVVKRRLGSGATGVVFLVEKDGQEYALKVPLSLEQNDRIAAEAEVLYQLRHQSIVEYVDKVSLSGRTCLLTRQAGRETIGDLLRRDGPLQLDLLQRFGEDLLQVLVYLEDRGVPHRDLKPDNLAVSPVGKDERLHLILFDFSLSRTPLENIRAGTSAYLDPFLPLRKPPRWDLQAERYSAAVTLYEMATGRLPVWGDGKSDPSLIEGEITLSSELFDAGLRDELSEFFVRALRRDPSERFDNAEEMLRSWRRLFERAESERPLAEPLSETELEEALARATFDTPLPELPIGTRALNALDRVEIHTAADLLRFPPHRLIHLRGVGNKTRLEITRLLKALRKLLGTPPAFAERGAGRPAEPDPSEDGSAIASVDSMASRLIRPSAKARGDSGARIIEAWLGLSASENDPKGKGGAVWPTQSEAAERVGLSRSRVVQECAKAIERWRRDPLVTQLRQEIVEILASHDGVMAMSELVEALLLVHGSADEGPERLSRARGLARAALEVERGAENPRYHVRRSGEVVLLATKPDLADYAVRLAGVADRLADEEKVVPPARLLQRLREVKSPPETATLSEARLLRLATAASERAALSSRQEIYPRGMEAFRTLKLSQGALVGATEITVEGIRDRIRSRYPEAAPIPDHPELDLLLKAAGFDLRWDPESDSGRGAYRSREPEGAFVSSGSGPPLRLHTLQGPLPAIDITPEIAQARQFEERLERALRERAFLALKVEPRSYEAARIELTRRFALKPIDLEQLFIESIRKESEKAGAAWDLVVQADGEKGTEDWSRLLILVRRALPRVESEILRSSEAALAYYPGLLGRYEQLGLLERLRDQTGRRDGIPGLWVLIPDDDQQEAPRIDGLTVPVIGSAQYSRIPVAWLENRHRSEKPENAGKSEKAVSSGGHEVKA